MQGSLHPRNWRALANRRTPWPQEIHPEEALQEMCGFLEYQLLADQQAARGRSLRAMIASGEIA